MTRSKYLSERHLLELSERALSRRRLVCLREDWFAAMEQRPRADIFDHLEKLGGTIGPIVLARGVEVYLTVERSYCTAQIFLRREDLNSYDCIIKDIGSALFEALPYSGLFIEDSRVGVTVPGGLLVPRRFWQEIIDRQIEAMYWLIDQLLPVISMWVDPISQIGDADWVETQFEEIEHLSNNGLLLGFLETLICSIKRELEVRLSVN